MRIYLFLALAFSSFFPCIAFAQSDKFVAVVEWDRPTTYENGAALPVDAIGGYEVMYRTNDFEWQSVLVVNNTATSMTLYDLAAGVYEVRVAVFDTAGVYSAWSESVFADIGLDTGGEPRSRIAVLNVSFSELTVNRVDDCLERSDCRVIQ